MQSCIRLLSAILPHTCFTPCTSMRGTSSRLEVKANFLLTTGRRKLSAHSSGSSYSIQDNYEHEECVCIHIIYHRLYSPT